MKYWQSIHIYPKNIQLDFLKNYLILIITTTILITQKFKNMSKQYKLGFSLIELSIVILVIGILVIGITKGSRIMQESRLKSARSLTISAPVSAISGLNLWLETTLEKSLQNSGNSYKVSDGESVKNWNDTNPTNTKPFVATEATNMPTYKQDGIGGLPTLFFDAAANGASGDFLQISYDQFLINNNFTVFIVASALEATTQWGSLISNRNGSTSSGYSLYKSSSNTNWSMWTGTGSAWIQIESAIGSFKKSEIFDLYRNDTDSKLYRNGQLVLSSTANYAINDGQPLQIGVGNNGISNQYFFDGYISEIISFNRALKDYERKSVEQYLSQKYSIKLP